jgi:hypothetical protein
MQSAVWNEKYHVLFVLESSAGRSNYLRLNNKARVVQCNLEGVPTISVLLAEGFDLRYILL